MATSPWPQLQFCCCELSVWQTRPCCSFVGQKKEEATTMSPPSYYYRWFMVCLCFVVGCKPLRVDHTRVIRCLSALSANTRLSTSCFAKSWAKWRVYASQKSSANASANGANGEEIFDNDRQRSDTVWCVGQWALAYIVQIVGHDMATENTIALALYCCVSAVRDQSS